MGGICALSGTKHSIPNAKSRILAGRGGAEDNSSEFGTRNPRKWWLMLVFASYLKQVEEIGSCGMYSDQVLIWAWRRRGKNRHYQVQRTLLCGFVVVSKLSKSCHPACTRVIP
ncbi:hypothetical protein H106_02263 [Trichophyton rubrum CBS 735.88]|nr:hypothetical protein H106_02263 [Trichophyton rubrum CBS 735.88]